jgi:hypothetical protein
MTFPAAQPTLGPRQQRPHPRCQRTCHGRRVMTSSRGAAVSARMRLHLGGVICAAADNGYYIRFARADAICELLKKVPDFLALIVRRSYDCRHVAGS